MSQPLNPTDLAVVALVELASLGCVAALWRSPSSLRRKLLLSLPVALPVLGPLLYFGVPGVQADGLRATETDTDD